MVTCTLVNTPKHGGQWCGSSDVVMIFARVRRSFGVSMQVINGVGSIEYFVVFRTSTNTLLVLFLLWVIIQLMVRL